MRSFSVKDSPPSASNSEPASDAWLPPPPLPLLLPLRLLPMSADERLVPPDPTWFECPDLAMWCNKIEINAIQCGSGGSGIVFYYALMYPHVPAAEMEIFSFPRTSSVVATHKQTTTLPFANMNASFCALLILQVESFKPIVAHWCLANRNVGLRAMHINLYCRHSAVPYVLYV